MDSNKDLGAILKNKKVRRVLTNVMNPSDTSEMRKLKEAGSSYNPDDPYLEIRSDKNYSYNYGGLTIFVEPAEEDSEVTVEDGSKVIIKKGDILGDVHFTPFGFTKPHPADVTAIIGTSYAAFDDFYTRLKDPIERVKLKFPVLFSGETNKEMAEFANKYAGFLRERPDADHTKVFARPDVVKKKMEESIANPDYLLRLAKRIQRLAVEKASRNKDLNTDE